MASLKRGVIMDLAGGKAVVLTPEGEFISLRRARTDWEVGQEIHFEWPEVRPWRVCSWIGRPIWAAAAAAVVLALILMPGIMVQAPTITPGEKGTDGDIVAYVTVDINPSVELALNLQEKVVSVTDLNEDADLLVEGLDWYGRPAEEVVRLLTEAAVEKAFLSPERANGVFITTVSVGGQTGTKTDNLPAERLEARLAAASRVVLEKRRVTAPVSAVEVTREVRAQAKDLGVSSGKLMLWLRAQDQGVKVPIEEFKGRKLAESIKKAGVESAVIYRPGEGGQTLEVFKKYESEIKQEIKVLREATKEELEKRQARDLERRDKERQERLLEMQKRLKQRKHGSDGGPNDKAKDQTRGAEDQAKDQDKEERRQEREKHRKLPERPNRPDDQKPSGEDEGVSRRQERREEGLAEEGFRRAKEALIVE